LEHEVLAGLRDNKTENAAGRVAIAMTAPGCVALRRTYLGALDSQNAKLAAPDMI
jgi:hypothetical protein